MTEWLPLSRVAVDARAGREVGPGLDHAGFRRQVIAWQSAFAARAGRDWALYFDDTLAFAAALYGAWHAGKRVYLCGDNLPATLERLAGRVDGFAGDVPAACNPLVADNAGDAVPAPLEEAATRLFVFTSGSTGEPVAIEKRLDQLAREVEALETAFGPALGDAAVHGTVSHQHIYGLLFRVLWPLAAARRIAARTFFHEDLLALLAREDRAQAEGEDFRLLGRADRIVKIEERRVSLDALERRICTHPAVAEARVCVLAGTRDTLIAVVVPNEDGWRGLREQGRRALSQQLAQHLASSHDAVTRPRRWRFAVALPTNAQGKVTERALTALFRPERPEPRWRLREAGLAELEMDLSADLAVFDGHFPQTAILPGVAQLDWAIRFGREAFALPPRFLRMEALKFQRVARPGDRIRLRLEWQPLKQALVFQYTSAHGPHASGRVVFAEGA